MTRQDQAFLEDLLRRGRPVQELTDDVTKHLGLEEALERACEGYAFEKHVYQLAGSPRDERAAYEDNIAGYVATVTSIQRRVDRWMQERLSEARWIGFGLEIPVTEEPTHVVVLPAQWLHLRLDSTNGIATGGGRRYECVRILTLSQLPPEQADKIPAFLERYARLAAAARHAKTVAGNGSMAPQIAAAIEKALERRLPGSVVTPEPIAVAVRSISPDALMRVQVAAMEIPAESPSTRHGAAESQKPETGAKRGPGRPSWRPRLKAQLLARAQAGQVVVGVAEEARELYGWAVKQWQQGDPPVPSPDAIENGIRSDYAQALATSNGIKNMMPKNK